MRGTPSGLVSNTLGGLCNGGVGSRGRAGLGRSFSFGCGRGHYHRGRGYNGGYEDYGITYYGGAIINYTIYTIIDIYVIVYYGVAYYKEGIATQLFELYEDILYTCELG